MTVTTSFAPWAKSTPWVARIDGKRRYFKTEALRDAAVAEYERGQPSGTLTTREVAEWTWARRLLPPGTSLRHVVEFFLAHNSVDATRTIADAAKAYLEVRSRERLRPRYADRLKQRMDRVVEQHGSLKLAQATPAWVEALCRNAGSPYVQSDTRTHLHIFFNWCLRQGWVASNPADARRVVLERIRPVRPGFLTVETTQQILDSLKDEPDLLAPFAMQLFSGVRSEEITRLVWSSVKVGEYIDISQDVSKTGYRRVIDWWPEALKAAVAPVKSQLGKVAPRNYHVRRTAFLRKAGIRVPHNGFRHSFASYGVALFQNAGQVSLLLGHADANLIFRHYREYTTKAEAERYFSLRPSWITELPGQAGGQT